MLDFQGLLCHARATEMSHSHSFKESPTTFTYDGTCINFTVSQIRGILDYLLFDRVRSPYYYDYYFAVILASS